MSRIGNKIITLPDGVTVTVEGNKALVKGKKGELCVPINHGISLEIDGSNISVKRANDTKQVKQNHGSTRANLASAIKGVSEGYKKSLEMIGIGYKAQMKGKAIELWAGYSHTVVIEPVGDTKISVEDQVKIHVEGIDKQAVGQTAALIRDVRRPEPYLGKGIRYSDERVITKEGKRASK